MSSCTFENEERGFNSVDEKPVRFDMTFTMVVPFADERMVPILERQSMLGLKKVNDGFELVEMVAPLAGKLEVFEKTVGGFYEKQDLGDRPRSECTKVPE